MKIKYLIKSILAGLGLSALLAVAYPITANAQYDPRPILEDATGLVWIGNQPYNPQLHRGSRIPIGTTINTEWTSRVVFTYYWPTAIYLSDRDVWLDVTCAKQVFMQNKGTYAKWFSHTVKRYDTPGRCDVTDDNGFSRAQQRAMQDPSIVSITSYDTGGKPDLVYSAPQVVLSQRRRQNFWNWWRK